MEKKDEKLEFSVFSDRSFMLEALKEARKAFEADEVPVGCVIVFKNRIIARAHNLRITSYNVCYTKLLRAERLIRERLTSAEKQDVLVQKLINEIKIN